MSNSETPADDAASVAAPSSTDEQGIVQEGTDSGYFNASQSGSGIDNAEGQDTPAASESNASVLADEQSGPDVYRDRLSVNEAGLQRIMTNPIFTHYPKSVLPNHVGYLHIQLPNSRQAEIMVVKDTEQKEEMASPVMEMIGQHVGQIKTEDDVPVSDNWMQLGQERNIEGYGDNANASVVQTSYQGSNTGAGDGLMFEQGGVQDDNLQRGDTGNVDPSSGKVPEVVPPIPDAHEMYESALAEQKKKNEDEQAVVQRQRQQEVLQLTNAIKEEMRKKAEAQAAEALKRAKDEEKAAHEKYLSDLKGQLARLQNPSACSNTPVQQNRPHTAKQTNLHGSTQMITNQGQHYQWIGNPATMSSPPFAGPVYVPPKSALPVTPQKSLQHFAFQPGGNRRSPRANISSLAFDASRKTERPLVSSAPSSCAGTPTLPQQPSAQLFSPIASSSPAKGNAGAPSSLLSPRSKKRPPTVTGQVLDQFLDRKRARKHGTPNQSPAAKPAVGSSTEDLKSQSERKYQLAKSLDVILKETLKQGNFSKIKKQVDEAGLQAIPVPEPFPKDLFCYTVSMYIGDITEQGPDARAAIVRKNCIDYIVSQMHSFAEDWMSKYCEEKHTDPFGWLSKHNKGDSKVDGLFVVLMAAYLRRPIQIFSHAETWTSDANIDGAVTLIFAGDNDFTAVEVAEKTFWTQLNAKLGIGQSSVAALFRIFDVRKKVPHDSDTSNDGYPRSDSDTAKGKKTSKAGEKKRREKKKQPHEIMNNKQNGKKTAPAVKGTDGELDLDLNLNSSSETPSTRVGSQGHVMQGSKGDVSLKAQINSGKVDVVQKEIPVPALQNFQGEKRETPKGAVKGCKTPKKKRTNSAASSQNGLICTICNKQFQWQRDLDEHLETHGLGYECAVCKVLLNTAAEYKQHRLSTHYVCNIGECDYFFGYPNGLTFHIQRKHGQEPKFPCLTCGVTYKSSLALYRHELNCKPQATVTLYKCQKCGAMVSENSRTEHDKTCKGAGQEKNTNENASPAQNEVLECKFCKGILSNVSEREQHEGDCYSNPEKKMACKLCNKIFIGARRLGQHLMGTHKQQATLCIYCHHGFKDPDSREKHYISCPGKKEQSPQGQGMTLRTNKKLQSR